MQKGPRKRAFFLEISSGLADWQGLPGPVWPVRSASRAVVPTVKTMFESGDCALLRPTPATSPATTQKMPNTWRQPVPLRPVGRRLCLGWSASGFTLQ